MISFARFAEMRMILEHKCDRTVSIFQSGKFPFTFACDCIEYCAHHIYAYIHTHTYSQNRFAFDDLFFISIEYSTKYMYPNGGGAHALNETFETDESNDNNHNDNNNNSSDDEAESDRGPAKKQRVHLDYILEAIFDTKDEAEEAVKAEGE